MTSSVTQLSFVTMAPLTNDDKNLIKILRLEKGYSTGQMMR